MKYSNARLKQMLSAEYALGTLSGLPRQRFSRLLKTRPDLQQEVRFWEARLAPLLGKLPPKAPRDLVWAAIDRQINAQNTQSTLPPAKTRSAALWQTWAVAASAAAVALSVQLYKQMNLPLPAPKIITVEQKPAFVAMLQAPKSDAVWLVSLSPDRQQISVVASGNYAVDQKSLELWILGDEGKAPVSLGLLPEHGDRRLTMPAGLKMPGKPILAVSVVPQGGSPTGLPTGPVILTAPVIAI